MSNKQEPEIWVTLRHASAFLNRVRELLPHAEIEDLPDAAAWLKHTESERQRWERRCKVLEARLAEIRGIVG